MNNLKLSLVFVAATLIITSTIFLSINLSNNRSLAANVTYYSAFVDQDNDGTQETCIGVNSGSFASILDSALADFDSGIGVQQPGIGTIYKSTLIVDCCFEQKANGNNPEGCEAAGSDFGGQDPWFASWNGNFYSSIGLPNLRLPTSGYFFQNQSSSRTSENTVGTDQFGGGIPNPYNTENFSFNDFILYGYDNLSVSPPQLSGFNNWYDYLVRLIPRNTNILSSSATSIVTSNSLSLGPNGTYRLGGDLSLLANSRCDGKYLVIVPGDLTINPSYKLQNSSVQNNQACLYLVEGEVTIQDNGNPAQGRAFGGINYDELDIGIITKGNINLEYGSGNPLFISGFLSANAINNQRNYENPEFPSLLVEHDRRYSEIFAEELKLLKFSLREKGYSANPS